MDAKTLPPLPEPTQGLGSHRWSYSAEDMRAYGDACYVSALEDAATLCEAAAVESVKNKRNAAPWDIEAAMLNAMIECSVKAERKCASNIRTLGQKIATHAIDAVRAGG